MLKKILPLIMLLLCLNMVSSVTFYVNISNAGCSDTFNTSTASSSATPICTFTRGLANITDGDIMIVGAGTYNASLGYTYIGKTLTSPILIKGTKGEEAIISGSIGCYLTTGGTNWKNMSNATVPNLWNNTCYSTSATAVFLSQNGTNKVYFRHSSLAQVVNLSRPAGYYFDTIPDATYLRLEDNSNPNLVGWHVSRNVDLTITNISGAEFRIENLTFIGGQKGIADGSTYRISNLSVVNCSFLGFSGAGLDLRNAGNITLIDNNIEQKRAENWSWNVTKGSNMESNAIYFYNGYSNINISSNNITNNFNGIAMTSGTANRPTNIIVADNLITNIYDDSIEVEDYCSNSIYTRNKMFDVFVGISVSPANCTYRSNFTYNEIVAKKKVLQYLPSTYNAGMCYKVIDTSPTINITIDHNTCFGKGVYASQNNSLQYINWTNNIFYNNETGSEGRSIDNSGWYNQGNFYDYNLYYNSQLDELFKYWSLVSSADIFNTLADALASPNWDGTWDLNSEQFDPGFLNPTIYNLTPTNTSAWYMSSTGSYVGAIAPASVSSWADYTNITAYYKLDLSGILYDSTGQNANGSVTGTNLNSSVYKINSSFQFNGQADQLITGFATSRSSGHSFCAWIYPQDNPPSNGAIIYMGQPGVYEFVTLGEYTPGCNTTTICYGTYDTAYRVARTNTSFALNTWQFFCAVKTTNQTLLYYNGVLDNFTTSGALSGSDVDLYIGGQSATQRNFTGLLDEVSFWNRSLSATEVYDLYNYGRGLSYPFATGLTAIVIPPTPADNSHNNTNITIKVNCTGAGAGVTDYRYYLWFDNDTATTPVLIASESDNWTTNMSLDDHYYYKAGCRYGDTYSGNTSVYNWYYDTTNPIITLGANNEFSVYNYSQQNQYDDILNLSIGFSDNILLYAYEINITNEAGTVIYNKTNTTLTGTSYTYSENRDISAWPEGKYFIKLSLADSHTANVIEEYDTVITKDEEGASLLYETAEGSNIKISSPLSTEASTVKKIDSYEFSFSYDQEKVTPEKVYIVESQDGKKVRHIKDSGYKAHFVIFDEETFNGNWIDFEGIEGTPSVVCESDYKCTVTFYDIKEEEITFKSIGGLNIIHEYYSWYRGDYTLFDEDVFTGEPVTIGINITNDTSLWITNVTLNHNGTIYNVSNVSGSDWIYFYQEIITPASNSSAVLYNWSLAVVQADLSVVMLYLTGNYTTYFWNVSINCSSPFNITAIRFTIFNEVVPVNFLNASLELNLSLWISNVSLAKETSINFTGNYTYDICLNANTTFYINLYAKDTTDGGFTHRYYLFNQTINGTNLLSISLYNFNTTTLTDLLRITARDSETYQYYPDIIGQLERYYVGEGIWRIVQMDMSDDYGLLIYDVVEKSVDYRIMFYDTQNNLLKTSDTLRFSCDAGVCEIVSLISPEGEGTSTPDLQVNNSYNNATKILNVSWADTQSLVSSVRILLTKETISGDTILFNVTQNGSSGSYVFNLSGVTGMVLVSVYKTASPESDVISWWINLVDNAFNHIIGNSEGALYSFIIMVVVIMIGLISPVACIVAGIVGLIGIYAFGLFGAISLAVIGVAIVMGIVLGIKIRR